MHNATFDQKTRLKSFLWASAAAIAATGFVAPVAYAQETDTASTEDASERRLGAVTVTSRKREENLQEVPISVTAIGDDTIDLLGATDLADVGLRAPNVLIDQNAGTGLTNLSIRGLSGASSLVGVYVDEFLINSGQGANTPLVDIEQVRFCAARRGHSMVETQWRVSSTRSVASQVKSSVQKLRWSSVIMTFSEDKL